MLLLSFYLINFFFHENYFYFFMFRDVPGCSGVFRNVPECSMFLVLSTPHCFLLTIWEKETKLPKALFTS